MLNIDALLAPIAANDPCGEDLAFSPEVDEIARARLADDPSLEQGAWVTALKEADWKFVGKRCALLIEARSKDLQLAVWLAEASARTDGLRGLADGLRLWRPCANATGTACIRAPTRMASSAASAAWPGSRRASRRWRKACRCWRTAPP